MSRAFVSEMSVRSCCDACKETIAREGQIEPGHFSCSIPQAPEGYRLAGIPELTDEGWREEVNPIAIS